MSTLQDVVEQVSARILVKARGNFVFNTFPYPRMALPHDPSTDACHASDRGAILVLGSWVGVRRPFHLSLSLTASRVALPQDPSTDRVNLGDRVRGDLALESLRRRLLLLVNRVAALLVARLDTLRSIACASSSCQPYAPITRDSNFSAKMLNFIWHVWMRVIRAIILRPKHARAALAAF